MGYNRSRYMMLSCAAIMATPVPAAFAQTTSVNAPPADGPGDIVVTARIRNESLQKVPESVTVLSEAHLENAGVRSVEDLTREVPNLVDTVSFRQGVPHISIRGVTTPQNGEAPLAFIVDGVVAPEVDFINQGIFDVASVQVLRGPQGALYGRGALAGAIVITTKQPTNEFSGSASFAYESGDDKRATASLSGPIVKDAVYFRVGGYYHNRDGQIRGSTVSQPLDFAKNDYSIRGDLKFVASPDLTITLLGQYSNARLGGGILNVVPIERFNDLSLLVDENFRGDNHRRIWQAAGKIEWSTPIGALTAVSSYADLNDYLYSDNDFSAERFGVQLNANRIHSFTQDIRLVSDSDKPLRYIVGGFYQDRKKHFLYQSQPDLPDDSTPLFDFDTETGATRTNSRAFAVFANVSYDITSRLEGTVALRYDSDRRTFLIRNDATRPDRTDRQTFHALQPKASLSYKITPDLLTYANYSRGFRTGGFNDPRYSFQPGFYAAETSDSFEVGVKATLLDGAMTLNGAVYHITLKNDQTTRFDLVSFTIGNQNLRSVESNGVEVELNARPIRGLEINVGLGTADAIIKDFNGTTINDNNKVPYVPSYTLNTSVTYETPISDDWKALVRVAYRQNGATDWDVFNYYRTGTKGYLDGRIGVNSDHLSLAVYARNLLNTLQPVGADDFIPNVTVIRSPSVPRSYGVEARFRF